MTTVLVPSLVCRVTSPCRTRRPRAWRHPARPGAPALALFLSTLVVVVAPGWAVPVAPWAARAAPPADTSSTPATAQPSHPVRLPSPRILVHLVVSPVRLPGNILTRPGWGQRPAQVRAW